jgi:3-phenylpropionate/trans-cinnamate dioxygenase ferredoxin subunit
MKHIVARRSELPDGRRIIVEINGRSVGVFNVDGELYAILNRCPHQGAELCKGSVLGRLEADVPGELRYGRQAPLLQCPWHGWEYDLRDGRSYFKSRIRTYAVDVEAGDSIDPDLAGRAGDATARPAEIHVGRSGTTLAPGPLVAETYPVSVEDDYIVVDTSPDRRRSTFREVGRRAT